LKRKTLDSSKGGITSSKIGRGKDVRPIPLIGGHGGEKSKVPSDSGNGRKWHFDRRKNGSYCRKKRKMEEGRPGTRRGGGGGGARVGLKVRLGRYLPFFGWGAAGGQKVFLSGEIW